MPSLVRAVPSLARALTPPPNIFRHQPCAKEISTDGWMGGWMDGSVGRSVGGWMDRNFFCGFVYFSKTTLYIILIVPRPLRRRFKVSFVK